MRTKQTIVLSFIILFILSVNSVLPEVSRGGKVTFSSYVDEREINGFMKIHYFIMNADGSDVNELIARDFHDENRLYQVQSCLSLSPDCTKAVFRASGEIRSDIFIIDINSRIVENLTEKINAQISDHPRWSPDGRKIAFGDYATKKIYIINSDGTNIKEIAGGKKPDWSPYGQRIAFADGDSIYIKNINTNIEQRVTTSPTQDIQLIRWSPNGQHILFITFNNNDVGRIYIVDLNGENLKLVCESTWQACWSPDGKKIAFLKVDSDKNWHEAHIWVMNPDGSEQERLTNNEIGETDPDWRNPSLIGIDTKSKSLTTTWGETKAK